MLNNKEIVYLSKGLPQEKTYNGSDYRSGIWNEQVDELAVGFDQIDGDGVANLEVHGGPERVVCLYPFEHYSYWKNEFGETLSSAAFGENITALEMKEDQVCIGDIYQIGDAVLQVSQGRYPCATINKRNNNNLLLKKIFETGFTGYFFRVLEEGMITTNSSIKLIKPHPMQVTVSFVHHLYFYETNPSKEDVERVLAVKELAGPWPSLMQEIKGKHNL